MKHVISVLHVPPLILSKFYWGQKTAQIIPGPFETVANTNSIESMERHSRAGSV